MSESREIEIKEIIGCLIIILFGCLFIALLNAAYNQPYWEIKPMCTNVIFGILVFVMLKNYQKA